MDFSSSTFEASLAAEPVRVAGDTGDVEYRAFHEESDLSIIMDLVDVELSEPYSIFTYRYFINQWPDLCYLAFVGTKCIGTIVCKMDEHKSGYLRGYIAMLVVLKQYRGRKVATELVNCCITVMLQAGCLEVILEAEVTNAGALALYGNLGFIRAKRLHRYYLNGADAYRLKLLFPQPGDEEEEDVELPSIHPTEHHEGDVSTHSHVHGEHCNHPHHPPPAHSTNGHLPGSHTDTHGNGTRVPAHVHGPSCSHTHSEARQQPPVHGPSCKHSHGGGSQPRQEGGHVHGPSCRHGNGNAGAPPQNEGREDVGHVHGPSCRHGQGEGGSTGRQGEAKGANMEQSGKKKGQKKKKGNKHRG